MNNNQQKSIQSKALSYHSDIANQLFSMVENQPWAMLLRSASQTHSDSRYDILVASPIVTLTTFGDETMVSEPSGVTCSLEDPFSLLAKLQTQYLPDQSYSESLPFVGGAVGYFSYDLGRRVEKLPVIAENDIKMPDMAVGLYQWAIVVDHHNKTARWVGINLEQAEQWLELQSKRTQDKQEFALTTAWQSNMTQESYASKFAQVQEYLTSGDCYQINLAQRFAAQYQGSEWRAYQKLERYNQTPFSAFIRTEEGAILSVSPERFLRLNGTEIETKPIKGTRPRSEDKKLDEAYAVELANAEKDQAENLMIVDLLRNDIGRVAAPGSVHVPKLFDIESFPAVHHLVSTIRAQLDSQYSACDLLKAGFPGGSITGAPKVRAMEIIEKLEPHRRSAYCGSIGYISRHGQMDTSITIRTLVAHQNKIYAWAGGGVVADSQCQAEFQETLDKLSRILPILER
ncbi:MAG: aminodeoxychorismate synthase component 1 [Vibrio sp.]|uniref:aminodeoxychorismate synthase component 1 n=1 Tax=Vibrio sp. TaxID=678 RepID=UPI003A840235